MRLPSGTVTFLFTDIEGSTQLWERHPEQMALSLARHDALLREIIETSNGFVFKTVGDGFYGVFGSAPDAVTAVVRAQTALEHEPWPEPIHLRVRMAVHTGEAQERDSDYFGPALNLVARLLATAHGGQALLSSRAEEAVRDHLPPDVGLRDLGSQRLKDLGRQEQVFQITHPRLLDSFPELRTLERVPNNLPQHLTTFLGREKEMAEVRSMLASTRLLTVTASGGSGKTRLALQTAVKLLDDYPDGVWLVELAAITDPALVPQTVAQALNVKERAGEPIGQTLIEGLRSQRILLVIDNCEHLISACAAFVFALLRACPKAAVLATSREPLGIAGEQIYRLAPLSLPPPKLHGASTLASVTQYEATRLFIARAHLVNPEFAVTDQNAPTLAQLCYHLDGIPLAIELAAARVRSLSLENINSRLESRFRLLVGGDRSALPRQQTLRGLVDWSYDLLSDAERTLFSRLSIFAGGWTLEAAEAVCGFDPIEDWEVLDLLTGLTDKSLVLAETSDEGALKTGRRYRMLETLRQYAMEKRDSGSDAATLARRHRDWALALAEDADSKLFGPDQAAWFERLEVEHDNLRAALSGALAAATEETSGVAAGDSASEIAVGVRLAGALGRFWQIRCHYAEGSEQLEKVLLQARRSIGQGPLPPALAPSFANALIAAGNLADNQGDFAAAQAFHEEALAICRAAGDRVGAAMTLLGLGNVAYSRGDYSHSHALYGECVEIAMLAGNMPSVAARALNGLGFVAFSQGDYALARSLYEQSLQIRREIGDRQGAAGSLNNLGLLAYYQADYDFARSAYEECLEIFRGLGDKQGMGTVVNNLGGIAMARSDFPLARTLLREALELRREVGDRFGVAGTLNNLGNVVGELGEYEEARRLHCESLTIRADLGDKTGLTSTLDGLAGLSFIEDDYRRTVVLRSAINTLRADLGSPMPPGMQEKHSRELMAASEILGADAYADAWSLGRSMTWDHVVAFALDDTKQATIQVL